MFALHSTAQCFQEGGRVQNIYTYATQALGGVPRLWFEVGGGNFNKGLFVLNPFVLSWKMAASEENFKSFLSRRKLEYSLRFPFLKEKQIIAKLRRSWSIQKSRCSHTTQRSKLCLCDYAGLMFHRLIS